MCKGRSIKKVIFFIFKLNQIKKKILYVMMKQIHISLSILELVLREIFALSIKLAVKHRD